MKNVLDLDTQISTALFPIISECYRCAAPMEPKAKRTLNTSEAGYQEYSRWTVQSLVRNAGEFIIVFLWDSRPRLSICPPNDDPFQAKKLGLLSGMGQMRIVVTVYFAQYRIGFVLAKMIFAFFAKLGLNVIGACEVDAGNGHGVSPILWIEASPGG